MSVTGGLEYDSRTDFSKTNSIYSKGLEPEEVKNTNEGLRAHLREIISPENKIHGTHYGYLFSYSGKRMEITTISKFRDLSMHWKNQKLIDKAYDVEAKRRGRIITLVNGIAKRILGEDFGVSVNYINSMSAS
jgi:hypothetical protein